MSQRTCPACQTANDANDQFCGGCGARLNPSADVAAAVMPAPPLPAPSSAPIFPPAPGAQTPYPPATPVQQAPVYTPPHQTAPPAFPPAPPAPPSYNPGAQPAQPYAPGAQYGQQGAYSQQSHGQQGYGQQMSWEEMVRNGAYQVPKEYQVPDFKLDKFSIPAFFFSWIWYLVKGMWQKGLVILAAGFVLQYVAGGWISFLAMGIYSGFFGVRDYVKYHNIKQQFWF